MGITHHVARCDDCKWECFSRNAHAVGVKHARQYKHKVGIEVGYYVDGAKE
jgi:hypothetical protein